MRVLLALLPARVLAQKMVTLAQKNPDQAAPWVSMLEALLNASLACLKSLALASRTAPWVSMQEPQVHVSLATYVLMVMNPQAETQRVKASGWGGQAVPWASKLEHQAAL